MKKFYVQSKRMLMLYALLSISLTTFAQPGKFSDGFFGDTSNYVIDYMIMNGTFCEITPGGEVFKVETYLGDERFSISTSAFQPKYPHPSQDFPCIDPWNNPWPADPNSYGGAGSRLGIIAANKDSVYKNFEMTVKIAKPEGENSNGVFDIGLVFGYIDPFNYSYVNINTSDVDGAAAQVVDGIGDRRTYSSNPSNQNSDVWQLDGITMFDDNEFHEVTIIRETERIEVKYEGQVIFSLTDTDAINELFSEEGAIGVGSWNDAAYFDDIVVKRLSDDPPTWNKLIGKKSDQLNLYPNPASQSVNITIPHKDCEQLVFFNIIGEVVKVVPTIATDKNTIGVNISDLKRGIYIVTSIGNGGTSSQRLVIN